MSSQLSKCNLLSLMELKCLMTEAIAKKIDRRQNLARQ
jgi:hypothetical protein